MAVFNCNDGKPVTTRIERSALVPFSDSQMYDLINDVASYPQYMDGCVGAEVLESSEQELVARLDLNKMSMNQSFVTRNQLTPPSLMTMELEEGPFDFLRGRWEFKALTSSACKVTFKLEFQFANKVMGKAAGKVLGGVANDLVDGLCKRAERIYPK